MADAEKVDLNSLVKVREALYRLIISQLYYDGQQTLASSMHQTIKPDPACPPSDRLFRLVLLGLQKEKEASEDRVKTEDTFTSGLDLEFESDMPTVAPEPAAYETCYVTSHKGACRSGCFSPDGQLIATGSVDASIKIIDVDRMLAKKPHEPDMIDASSGHHPVIKTLYDHVDEVTWLEFHPRLPLLASGSRDTNIKIFEYSKSSVKKATTVISDAIPVRCFSFHPSGDYMAVGTDHTAVRVYDIATAQCYVNPFNKEHHTNRVTSTQWSPDARVYVTGSNDGSIKLWDGVSSRCVNTFPNAHDGAGISSVVFSKNGKYVLSSGKDSMVKLWELSTSRCLIAYTGAGIIGKQQHRSRAIFNHTEDFVMLPDEATKSLCSWDARNASRKQLMSLCHNSPVRHIIHSPVTSAFMSCSDDFRARFWVRRAATH
ncbi:cleavage stimulation factor subunit 1-like [Amphibalanus amphitrite]|uniref:cleavage stimulation factor subunit 1-like n=1 Tax=Amphibalanus amphitrite TaxID=1232801 RepID=UPI001C91A81F|nr:cleavage stimulation factor subunit 1-like [Amphibalanus amphitrite]XP_043203297.1 cleavage stimulation factor subunit 1-like [Amphibalanus amphitrite]